MKVLIDLDSLLYRAVYKIISFSEIKFLLGAGHTREMIEGKIINESNERLQNMIIGIGDALTDIGIEYESFDVELYVTLNTFSRKKAISPRYKKGRKGNKWASMLRAFISDQENVFFDLEEEADDMIAIRARKLGIDNCIVCSIDKDLDQIEGWHFDLYQVKTGEVNEYGQEVKEYRGIYFVDKESADNFIWRQMLQGDRIDGIEGVRGLGKVKAGKIIDSAKNKFITVSRIYADKVEDWKDEFRTNYALLKIG